jgi:arsenate reductase
MHYLKKQFIMKYMLYPALEKQVKEFEEEFSSIPNARKRILQQLATFIQQKQKATASIDLNFICTHNSRRSHIAQLWAQVGAAYYRIDNVRCFFRGHRSHGIQFACCESNEKR